jgi:hypothetical protein
MARRRKNVRALPPAALEQAESRGAELITSLWMLSAVNALGCEIVWIGLRVYIRNVPDAKVASLLAGLLLIVAMILGLVIMGLTPVVYRVRRVAPPPLVTLVAVLIGIAAWVAAATLAVVD